MAKSILIVEDDNNIADLLRLYLEKEGYQATIAADGTQGIDLYRDVYKRQALRRHVPAAL